MQPVNSHQEQNRCEKDDEIREIIESKWKRTSKDWFCNPIGADGSMDDVLVTVWNGLMFIGIKKALKESDLRKAEGKLPWRIDWPARWGWIGTR